MISKRYDIEKTSSLKFSRMNADDKIVLLCGAPFVGRSFYSSKFSLSHDIIDVRHMFESDPEMTVRQLINKHVQPLLKQNKKVIIDDSFPSASQRKAYVSLLLNKLPSVQIACVDCQPLHGESQLKWSKEFHSAEVYLYDKTESYGDRLHEWRRSHETLSEEEGFVLRSASLPLNLCAPYHCSFPGFLLEWSAVAVVKNENHVSLVKGCCECIDAWAQSHPNGRIIIINDKPPTKGASANAIHILITSFLEQLTSKVLHGPVYLIQVDSGNSRYANSALNAGLFAFVQRIFLLDLQHEASVYVYQTEGLQKIVERVGLKHVKANRAFSISSSARMLIAAQRSPVPAFLKSMNVLPKKDSEAENFIPLWTEAQDSSGNIVWKKLPCKGCLYMASASKDCLKKFQEEFCATRVLSHQPKPAATESAVEAHPPSTSKKLVQRKLPDWMTSDKKRKETHTPRTAVLSTMYIMNAEELLETAKSYLSECEKKRRIDEPTSSLRVSNTSSSNASSKPSISVPDSFVSNSTSSHETKARKPDITISESLVINTPSESERSSSTSVKSFIACVKDSLVSASSSGVSKASSGPPDVLVPETVTTVPETVPLKMKSSSLEVKQHSPRTDLSHLDDLFL